MTIAILNLLRLLRESCRTFIIARCSRIHFSSTALRGLPSSDGAYAGIGFTPVSVMVMAASFRFWRKGIAYVFPFPLSNPIKTHQNR